MTPATPVSISEKPFASILVPCYNEEKYLPGLVADLLEQDYPREKTEVFFIDGASTDRTAELIRQAAGEHAFFYYLPNPGRYVPFALNLGISKARGEVIIRMDAHARYPAAYVSTLVAQLFVLGADNVGGRWLTVPQKEGIIPLAIAEAMSSPFGVGNAMYRLKSAAIRLVDTVPFGCYRRDVFDRIGLFDEALIRNQDDEFNGRLTRAGGKIYLLPGLIITYFARESIPKVMKMFYQYGFFKPLVNKKIGGPATVRQLIPPAMVLFLVIPLLLALFYPPSLLAFGGLILLHLSLGLLFSFSVAKKSGKTGLLAAMPICFLAIHLSYGYGYLCGLLSPARNRRKHEGLASSR